ncbi:hypothetical protein [Paenibacillus sp. FSL E2-0178]|uniref:hypothetical protein n=1 Tax=Paenibacillus sp. FSL E2-0178 TaxID=2921361 RepID=UPI0031592238
MNLYVASVMIFCSSDPYEEKLGDSREYIGLSVTLPLSSTSQPAIRPVIITLLILKIGHTLDLGFEHMYVSDKKARRNPPGNLE